MARRLSGDYFEACPCPSDDGGGGGMGDSREPTFGGTRTRINAGRASRVVTALVLISALPGFAPAARAQAPPAYMNTITGTATTTKAQVAEGNMLALNVAMFGYYDRALRLYQQRLLAQHPVILALFSGAGGEFTLYRPGMTPLRAPSVPTVYQVLKSVGHSSMALFQIAGPHLDNPADQSWRALMEVNYYLMDYELMGGNARDAIVSEAQKRGMAPFLPPLAPFGSHEWPWKITPGPGPGTLRQLLSP